MSGELNSPYRFWIIGSSGTSKSLGIADGLLSGNHAKQTAIDTDNNAEVTASDDLDESDNAAAPGFVVRVPVEEHLSTRKLFNRMLLFIAGQL